MVHSGGSPRFTAFCTHAAAPGTAPEAPGAERGDLWVGAPGGALVRGAPRERCLRGTTGRLRAAGRHRGSLGLYRGCQCYFCWSLVLDMPGGAGDAFAGNRAYGIDLGCVLFAVWCGEKFRPVCFLLVSSRKFQQLTGQVWKHANKMLAGLAWEGDGVLELHSSLIQANSWCPYRHGDVNLMVSVLQWRMVQTSKHCSKRVKHLIHMGIQLHQITYRTVKAGNSRLVVSRSIALQHMMLLRVLWGPM